ncbi:bifunctional 4-hydroxy-2-oxoglutarate aldolase/2-dehydro-3-deoxy-phosphogluconate aldolase [Thalassospira alkalitolerans]|uniref:2-dehydro-3-deoxy-phosphogluconate aldolase n=1 Tax=Thalassospira alkalitolerans TaxID=1293890 RepID=A0A1Y2L7H4_9PROT|nr:bifunctional 4-hydroxy-2-oxoglutarate aldolase/2-dehydro-3-deoxy-phosphogluconate aldolase [Thalassospira alkalitolerans]OSQ43841.1 keto-deoxy-phosphogluconate aldolase [Thalassospira alkalitolerans]|tara:strand:+ start:444554 stop:445195 length:642 start_codon:yes stop_codon:yes gene_type:complete
MSLSSHEILSKAPVVPVLVIEDVNDAVPLAKALVAGGLRVLEITLRSAAAEESIKRIIAEVPDAITGAGTVINAKQMERMAEIGCAFAVSPGHTDGLLKAAKDTGVPLLPGAGTPSEIMHLIDHGYDILKFFPAEQQGGVSMLKALSGPLPQVKFCPTGGVSLANLGDYLALPNIITVGGSWVSPKSAVKAGDWATITRLAQEATDKVAELRG